MRRIFSALLVLFFISVCHAVSAQEGVFLWKSEALYSAQAQQQLLRHAEQHGLERIYWGVTADQARHPALMMAKLGAVMRRLDKQGTQSWLLLGDPHWILPEHRADLINILGRFEALPFSGVMLDLEVEQLGFPVPQARLDQWLDTLETSTKATQKPVEITAHWRWFASTQEPCIACKLTGLGVSGASLMIYTTNIDRVNAIIDNAERSDGIKLRVVQSLEPFLSKEESWAHKSREQRQHGVTRLRRTLQTPLDWQAYEFIDQLD